MKNGLWKLGIAVGTLLTLAACGNGGSAGTGDSTAGGGNAKDALTVWAWDPKFNIAAFEMAEADYQKDNPDFKLNIVENAQKDMVQKLNTNLSSGTKTGLPNIVMIEDYRAKSFLEAFPDSFFPVTDFIDPSEFMDYKIAATSVDGVQYGIPFDSGVTGLFLRKSVIGDAGLAPEDFTDITWTEFIELGKQVKDKTDKPLLSSDMNDLGLLRTMMHSSGSWYSKEDGSTPNFAGNESLKIALQDFKEMMDSGVMITHNAWDQLVANFNSGRVAGVAQGNWIIPSIKAEESQAGDWVVVPYPRQEGIVGATNASNLGGSSIYILNIDGKEEAAEFIAETFGKDVDFYEDLATEIGAIGSYEPAAETETYQQEDAFFDNQKIYHDFIEWAKEVPAVNFGKNTYAFEDVVKTTLQDYMNGKDLDKALEEAQKTAETQVK